MSVVSWVNTERPPLRNTFLTDIWHRQNLGSCGSWRSESFIPEDDTKIVQEE